MSKRDAVVVGAGAMGLSAAWWLARGGRDVVVLEQFEQGHDRGSSHGSARIFRLAYPDPLYVRLAQEALPLWRELENEAGAALLTQTGAVDHGHPAMLEAIAGALDECGARREFLSPEEANERWPGMRFEERVLFHAEGGRVDADATRRALEEVAARLGAEIRFSERVSSIRVSGEEPVVATAEGEYRTPVVVVACGAWIEKVLSGVVPLPGIRVTQEQPAHFSPHAPMIWPSFIHHFAGPDADSYELAYGLEAPGVGVKVGEHMAGDEVDPDRRDRRPHNERLARLGSYVKEWFPGLDPEPVSVESCLYTTTPTEDFILDRVGPVVIGSPCSGHGFKFTPVIGRILADLALGRGSSEKRFRLESASC